MKVEFLKNERQFLEHDYERIPYFELLAIAEKEQDLEKRNALFEFSNMILAREFMKLVKKNEQKSLSL